MADVVLVHGIAQEQKQAEPLENDWIPALAGGVHAAGFGDLADRLWRDRTAPSRIDVRMAFYGALFLRPGQQSSDPAPLSSSEDQLAEELALEWLQRAATRSSRPGERDLAKRELAYLRPSPDAVEASPRSVTRRAVNSLSRLRWFAPTGMALATLFVNRTLAQVTRYFVDDAIRERAIQAVLVLVGPETRAIVSHSLGTIVAYEACYRLTEPLPLLITLGSPLGLGTIVYPRLRPQPPAFPPLVRRWVNIADRDDLIASEPDLTELFTRQGLPPGATFEGRQTVNNGAKPHEARFYLTKAEVGRPLAETLPRAPGSATHKRLLDAGCL